MYTCLFHQILRSQRAAVYVSSPLYHSKSVILDLPHSTFLDIKKLVICVQVTYKWLILLWSCKILGQLWNLAKNKVQRCHNRPHKITLTFDINCKVEKFPKLILSLIMYQKDSQNSLKTVAFTVMLYYRERIQINISQRRRCLEQGPEDVTDTELLLLPSPPTILLAQMCGDTTEYCQAGKCTCASSSEFYLSSIVQT